MLKLWINIPRFKELILNFPSLYLFLSLYGDEDVIFYSSVVKMACQVSESVPLLVILMALIPLLYLDQSLKIRGEETGKALIAKDLQQDYPKDCISALESDPHLQFNWPYQDLFGDNSIYGQPFLISC